MSHVDRPDDEQQRNDRTTGRDGPHIPPTLYLERHAEADSLMQLFESHNEDAPTDRWILVDESDVVRLADVV